MAGCGEAAELLQKQVCIRDVQLAAATDAIRTLQMQNELLLDPGEKRRPEILHASQLRDYRLIGKGSVSLVWSATLMPTDDDVCARPIRRVAVKMPRTEQPQQPQQPQQQQEQRLKPVDIINRQNSILHELSLWLPRHPGVVRPSGAVVLPADISAAYCSNSASSEHGSGSGERSSYKHVVASVSELWEEGTLDELLVALITARKKEQKQRQESGGSNGGGGGGGWGDIPPLLTIRFRDVVFVVRRLASALDALHRANLVHGDVCARNVVIRTAIRFATDADNNGTRNDDIATQRRPRRLLELGIDDAALIDFNLSSPMNRQLQDHQVECRVASTYHPPDHVLTAKTDVYSLGYIIAQLCAECSAEAALPLSKEPSQIREALCEIEVLAHACLSPDPMLRPWPRDVIGELEKW